MATGPEMRRAAYERLRAERPRMFVNQPDAPITIVVDGAEQDRAAAIAAQAQRDLGLPAEYGDVGVLYEDPYLKVVKDAVRFRSGRLGTYVRTCPAVDGEAVVMVVTTPEGGVVLIRHYRHGCREWHWEFPRGFAEPGLDGPGNAAKEIEEELGVVPSRITFLGWLDDQQSDRKVGVYHATAVVPVDLRLTDGAAEEGIDEVCLRTAADLHAMVLRGELSDLFTLGAYAIASANGVLRA